MSIDVITANKAQMGILSSVLRIDPSPSDSSSKSSTDHQQHLAKFCCSRVKSRKPYLTIVVDEFHKLTFLFMCMSKKFQMYIQHSKNISEIRM